MRGLVALIALSVAGCATTSGGDWSHFDDGSVVSWLERDAAPYFARTLTEHPRFAAEPVAVVIMQDEKVATRSHALAIALRDQLHAALLEVPGLSVSVHEPGAPCAQHPRGYYLGVELVRPQRAATQLTLRLYDAVERRWVSGFSRRWTGRLTSEQVRMAARQVVPDSARGARVLPFGAAQSDLLAAQLAAKLACKLQRAGNDELVVQPARHGGAALVAGNLAARHAIPVASSGTYELDTRVHEVDRGLYQVWAILTPQGGVGLQSVVSEAYASAPLLRPPVERDEPGKKRAVPAAQDEPAVRVAANVPRHAPLVSNASVVGPVRARDCERTTPRGGTGANRVRVGERECFAIEFDADADARVFVVGRETDAAHVRVHPSNCVPGGVGPGRAATHRFPSRGAIAWDPRGGDETFFIIAARGREAHARITALIEDLRPACGARRDPRRQRDFPARLDDAVAELGSAAGYATVTVHHGTSRVARRIR